MRNGKYLCDAKHGVWLKLPLFDTVIEDNRVPLPVEATVQTLTTLDGVTISMQVYYEYEIIEPSVFLLKNENGQNGLTYRIMSQVKKLVVANSYERVRSEKFADVLHRRVIKLQSRYGANIPVLDVLEVYRYDGQYITHNPSSGAGAE